jgi:type I site-specific restriction endonuclease
MTQIREDAYFTKGRLIVRGKTVQRGEAKKADYILYYKPNVPLAVLEAKDNNHAVGDGMQQALHCPLRGITCSTRGMQCKSPPEIEDRSVL